MGKIFSQNASEILFKILIDGEEYHFAGETKTNLKFFIENSTPKWNINVLAYLDKEGILEKKIIENFHNGNDEYDIKIESRNKKECWGFGKAKITLTVIAENNILTSIALKCKGVSNIKNWKIID